LAIPDFYADGFLPPGIHDCEWQDFVARLGGKSVLSTRARMTARLAEYLQELRSTGLISAVIVDGSFVSIANDPNDVDLVLVATDSSPLRGRFRPDQYNALSRRRVLKRYRFDAVTAAEGTEEYKLIVEFFMRVREDPDRQKGLVRLTL
jgi:hypothetical protein